MITIPSVVNVATGGTPVQAWPSGPGSQSDPVPARAVVFQNVASVGNAYIGNSTLNRGTLAGVFAGGVLAPGASYVHEDMDGANNIDTTNFWVDHDTDGANVLASYGRR